MKRLTQRMSIFMVIVLSFALVGLVSARTYYVDVQEGNDSYNGWYATYQGNGLDGPKKSINGAIAAASPGDVISVDYATNNLYDDVTLDEQDLTFTSTGGAPRVARWTHTEDKTFTGPFRIQYELRMDDGVIKGSNASGNSFLTVMSDAKVYRKDGSIARQLNFEGPTDFFYQPGTAASVLTGLELPTNSDTSSFRNLTVNTKVVLNEDKRMNGVLTTTGEFDLGSNILTLVGLNPQDWPGIQHSIGADVINGLLDFTVVATAVAPAGDSYVQVVGDFDLPNVTATSRGPVAIMPRKRILVLHTNKSTGIIRAMDGVNIFVPNAGGAGETIGGIVQNGSQVIDFGTFTAPGPGVPSPSSLELNVTGDLESLGSGTIVLQRQNQITLGGVKMYDGLVQFDDLPGMTANDKKTIINGDTEFLGGKWNFAYDPTGSSNHRELHLKGQNNKFSTENSRTDFSYAKTYAKPVWLVISGAEQQTLVGNSMETIWYGIINVNNTAGQNPSVTFQQGVFRVLPNNGHQSFFTSTVHIDDCTIAIGGRTAPFDGNGNFINRAGYTTANGGRVQMNGNGGQNINTGEPGDPAPMFGSLEIDNPSGVTINNSKTVTITNFLYLTEGLLKLGTGASVKFKNSSPAPTIVRVDGQFQQAPDWANSDSVNVVYFGGVKVAGEEIPVAGTFPNALNDLSVKTTKGCGDGKGGVEINDRNVVVNGILRVNEKQALLVKSPHTLTLKGDTVVLDGILVTEGAGELVLANPTGTTLKANAANLYLPSITVAAGSNGNKIEGFLGLVAFATPPADICDVFTGLEVITTNDLGNLKFLANGVNQTSSLETLFAETADAFPHLNMLQTDAHGTLTLLADVIQHGDLDHRQDARIVIAEHNYTVRGARIDLSGAAPIEGTSGTLFFNGTDQDMYIAQTSTADQPEIDANVEINLQTSIFELHDNTSDSLTLKKNFTFRKGTMRLGDGSMPVHLALLGKEFHLYGDAGFDVLRPGVLFLNAMNAPMQWFIYHNSPMPEVNHLTVQKSVTLMNDGKEVTVNGNYVHQDGSVDLRTNNLIVNGTFTRMAGTYDATTGYLKLLMANDPNPVQFVHGDSNFEIPNFWIEVGREIATIGDGYFTIERRLLLKNTAKVQFKHERKLKINDGVTVFYHSGDLDKVPDMDGQIRLIAIHEQNGMDIPENVWPENSNKVSTLVIMTWPTFMDDAAPTNTLAVKLTLNHAIGDSLVLRNGILDVTTTDKSLTFADGLTIIRVDGAILPGSAINSNGTGYIVIYQNNNNPDILGTAITKIPANAGGNYIVSGLELPNEVASLTFTRYQNVVNRFTVLAKPVTVTGSNTLNIRNNLSVQPNATLTVLGDTYFENESIEFPLATDPICEFWSPLVFAGSRSPQMVYVPKDGIDIRPPVAGGTVTPGPARIKIAKDNPANTVRVTGGDLVVDWISFCNGLLDTDDNNSVQIPAPAPGLGQGFDRDCLEGGNISHSIGRITKRFQNDAANNEGNSSNEYQEFPVGSRDKYRPMSFTFRNTVGQVTIPPELELTVEHVDTPPRGSMGIPIADNCGHMDATNTYAPFYWFVESNGNYTQEEYDLVLSAPGLDPASYDNVNQLRILRRHGNISETENNWLLQGSCSNYDNALYTEGPTVINEHAKGGLRTEGAIFTVGMPYGDLPVAKHFDDKLVWDGNPYNAMTFYVTRAEYWTGKPLQPGDEIGIYDGSSCVGYVKLTKEVSREDYAIVVCSKDDDPMDGVKNGYTEGNKIYFRYWDSKTDTEYSVDDNSIEYYKVGVDEREYDVVFEQRSTRVELLNGEPRVGGQDIWLTKGWNIFSLAVDPEPITKLFDTTTPNLFGQGILNPIEPQLLKVQDEDGNTIEVLLGSWQDNIGNWQNTEGYYVKVSEDVLLQVQSNELIQTPLDISLGTGWNIISFPCLESQQDAIDVLQSLIDLDVLDKAMDQYGHALERLAFVTENNGWYNGIGAMEAGQGYYIKVKSPATLQINCAGQDQLPKLLAAKEAATPKHFARERGNPYMPMNIFLNDVKIDGQSLSIGDEIAVYDGDKIVGSVVVEHSFTKEKPLALIAGMDDGSGNGFAKGNSISFRVWKADVNQEVEISLDEVRYLNADTGAELGSQAFEPRATAAVTITSAADIAAVPQAFELNQNYPNPFNPSTMITFAIPNEANVKVQVYDITGKLVTTLVDNKMSAGYHNIEWTGTDANGRRVATGIYFYKMTAGNFVQTKKMLFAK